MLVVICHLSFVICHWSLVICHWSLVIGHLSFPPLQTSIVGRAMPTEIFLIPVTPNS
ncbi:MAG: hypothetical protein HEQ19_00570 [Gloeotrichia echinulata CP02]